jgi:hypothetical protein
MSRRTSAIISAAITLVIFTVLPLYAPSLIPPEYVDMVAEFGIDIVQFTSEIAMIGGVIAAFTLVKGFVEPSSVLYPLSSIAMSGVTLFFTVVTVSLGRLDELANLGLTTITMEVQGTLNTMTLDFRVFIWVSVATVALKIIEAFLEFSDAKKQTKTADVPQPIIEAWLDPPIQNRMDRQVRAPSHFSNSLTSNAITSYPASLSMSRVRRFPSGMITVSPTVNVSAAYSSSSGTIRVSSPSRAG